MHGWLLLFICIVGSAVAQGTVGSTCSSSTTCNSPYVCAKKPGASTGTCSAVNRYTPNAACTSTSTNGPTRCDITSAGVQVFCNASTPTSASTSAVGTCGGTNAVCTTAAQCTSGICSSRTGTCQDTTYNSQDNLGASCSFPGQTCGATNGYPATEYCSTVDYTCGGAGSTCKYSSGATGREACVTGVCYSNGTCASVDLPNEGQTCTTGPFNTGQCGSIYGNNVPIQCSYNSKTPDIGVCGGSSASCTSGAGCASGACVSQSCTAPNGTDYRGSSCVPGAACGTSPSGATEYCGTDAICGSPGSTCTSNDSCVRGVCTNSKCASGGSGAVGSACSTPSDCAQGVCQSGKCSALTSSNLNALCFSESKCGTAANGNSEYCTAASTSGGTGTCGGTAAVCQTYAGCISGVCSESAGTCVTTSNYNAGDSCGQVGQTCGYSFPKKQTVTCSSSNICGGTGAACASAEQCDSTVCGASGCADANGNNVGDMCTAGQACGITSGGYQSVCSSASICGGDGASCADPSGCVSGVCSTYKDYSGACQSTSSDNLNDYCSVNNAQCGTDSTTKLPLYCTGATKATLGAGAPTPGRCTALTTTCTQASDCPNGGTCSSAGTCVVSTASMRVRARRQRAQLQPKQAKIKSKKSKKRAQTALDCPAPLHACALRVGGGHECLDLNEELAHCGRCGYDCEAVHPNASRVGCQNGHCKVLSCNEGARLVKGDCVQEKARAIEVVPGSLVDWSG